MVSHVGPNAGGDLSPQPSHSLAPFTFSVAVLSRLGYGNCPRSMRPLLFPGAACFHSDQSSLLGQPSRFCFSIAQNPQMVLTPLNKSHLPCSGQALLLVSVTCPSPAPGLPCACPAQDTPVPYRSHLRVLGTCLPEFFHDWVLSSQRGVPHCTVYVTHQWQPEDSPVGFCMSLYPTFHTIHKC